MSEIRTRLQGGTPFFPNMLNNGSVEVCLKEDVDKVLAEKDEEIAELKKKLMPCLNGDCILTCEVVEKYGKENAELKAKLEDVNELVKESKELLKESQKMHQRCADNASKQIRMLKRALWLARAERAKEHVWHDVKTDGSPRDDYKGHDWVLVQYQKNGGFLLIPRIAEYRKNLKRWVPIDENDITPHHDYLSKDCRVIGWRDIDFAYYGRKFFVQQEINKNVERKCRAKAEEYK